VAGNYAYVAHQNGWGGLAVIDITNPAAPVQVGHVSTSTLDHSNPSYGVELLGTRAYLSTQDGVQVLDISNPTAPTLVTTVANTQVSWDLEVDGGYLYLTSWYRETLDIFDLSNPTAPTLVGSLSVGHPSGVAVAGNTVLLANSLFANGDPSVFLVDATNKTTPLLLDSATAVNGGIYNFGNFIETIVAGNHVFLLPLVHIDVFRFSLGADEPPTCASAQVDASELWPPNHHLVDVSITGVVDPEGSAVSVSVTGVTQDEPVNGQGDGDTSPDAVLEAGRVLVRAERAQNGNGRVYRVAFSATDGSGSTCVGAVSLGVPKSQSGQPPVDDGQIYDSLVP
jgi:hypothetical protein